jgi:hypothetical protein
MNRNEPLKKRHATDAPSAGESKAKGTPLDRRLGPAITKTAASTGGSRRRQRGHMR